MKRNPYEVLGLTPAATDDEIRRAFKKIAVETHPDKNPGDATKESIFKEANTAFQTLGDPDKRARWDAEARRNYSNIPHQPNVHVASSSYEDIFSGFVTRIHEEVFRQNAQARQEAARQAPVETEFPGDDITTQLRLTLAEAVYGTKKTLRVRSSRPAAVCSCCQGTGAEPGTQRITCGVCSGSGKSINFSGSGTRMGACMACRGRGSMSITPCKHCSGQGKMIHEADVTVSIPAGISEGQQLRLAGMGVPGSPPGSLYLTIEVEKHPTFIRQGRDLFTSQIIPWVMALRGGIIQVQDLRGEHHPLEIPAGIQSGSTVVSRGHGVLSTLGGTNGNLHVQLHVEMPKILTPRAQELIDLLVEELSPKP